MINTEGRTGDNLITSSLCLSSVVPISLYFSVVLSKFNKGLWQFRKSCEVMFENESQVVKVIINGLHDCHFLLIVVYTLYRERCILHGSLSSFGSMPFTNKCPRGYQCVYTLIFNIDLFRPMSSNTAKLPMCRQPRSGPRNMPWMTL